MPTVPLTLEDAHRAYLAAVPGTPEQQELRELREAILVRDRQQLLQRVQRLEDENASLRGRLTTLQLNTRHMPRIRG